VILPVLAAMIAIIDALQVVLIGKGWGAIGGTLIYGTVAWRASRGDLRVAWIALLLPLLPTSIVFGLQGAATRAAVVDEPMLVVYGIQLAAAAAAAVNLGSGRGREPDPMR